MTQHSNETSLQATFAKKQDRSIDRLFLKFATLYGQVWRKQFSGEFLIFAKNEWLKGLINFDESILDLAVEVCRKTLELPPTMPKFIEICRSFHNRRFEMQKPSERIQHVPSKIGEKALKEIKQRLRLTTNKTGGREC